MNDQQALQQRIETYKEAERLAVDNANRAWAEVARVTENYQGACRMIDTLQSTDLRRACADLEASNATLQSTVHRLEAERNAWYDKAVERVTTITLLEEQVARLEAEKGQLQQRIEIAESLQHKAELENLAFREQLTALSSATAEHSAVVCGPGCVVCRQGAEADERRQAYGAGPDWQPPNPAYEVDGAKLLATTDASIWASEFVKRFGGDEGLMLTYFANAIMVGHDWAMRKASSATAEQPNRAQVEDIAAFVEHLRLEYVSQLLSVKTVARSIRERYLASEGSQ